MGRLESWLVVLALVAGLTVAPATGAEGGPRLSLDADAVADDGIRLVSRKFDGQPADAALAPSISGDGRYVSFASDDPDIVPGIENSVDDIFVFDSWTGSVERITLGFDGSEPTQDSRSPVLSGDGRFVAFLSSYHRMADPPAAGWHVYVHDRLSGSTVRASDDIGDVREVYTTPPDISRDGSTVVFTVELEVDDGDPSTGQSHVFAYDIASEQVSRVTVTADGTPSDGLANWASVSGDGDRIAFVSNAVDLVDGVTEHIDSVYVRERSSNTTWRVPNPHTEDREAWVGCWSDRPVVLSGEGDTVAFCVEDGHRRHQIYVYALEEETLVLASENADGDAADDQVAQPALSDDGRLVAFYSRARNLVSADPGPWNWNLFTKDLVTGAVRAVSVNDDGEFGDANAPFDYQSSRYLDADGEAIVFASDSSNFGYPTGSRQWLVYLWPSIAGIPPALPPGDPAPPPDPTAWVMSPEESFGAGNEAAAHDPHCHEADPINCATGNFWVEFVDVEVPGRGPGLGLSRTYNALDASASGAFGFGWSWSYGMRLVDDGEGVTVVQESGSELSFASDGEGGYEPAASWAQAQLVRDGEGWELTRHRREVFTFDEQGRLTSVRDLNGHATVLSYDAEGLLSAATDQAGRRIAFEHDEAGRITGAIDPAGNQVRYGYDPQGNLSSVEDPAGGTWTFTYEDRRLTQMVDPEGGVVTNLYDDAGRVVEQTGPEGGVTSFTWEEGRTTIVDPDGNVEFQDYDRGVLTAVTKGVGTPQEATWTYANDLATLGPTTITDPTGRTTRVSYDAHGSPLEVTDPAGNTTTWTYGPFGEPLTMTDPAGVTTTWSYDDSANLLAVTRPLTSTDEHATVTFGYDGQPGDITAVTDPEGATTRLSYDADGNLTSATDPLGNTTTFSYDVLGRTTAVVDPAGNVDGVDPDDHRTEMTHTALGDLATIVDPTGATQSYVYDAMRRPVEHADADGNVTRYVYDDAGRLERTVRPDGSTLRYEYRPGGDLAARIDGAGARTAYDYDPLNRVAAVTDPLGRTTTYEYDGAGRNTAIHHPDGETTTHEFTPTGQIARISYSDGRTPTVEFEYDEVGRHTLMRDGTGTTTFAYDSLGRLTETVDGRGDQVAYTHDLAGRTTSITYPHGGVLTRAHDAAGRLVALTDWLDNTTTFDYDPNGNLVRMRAGNGVESTFSYDPANRPESIAHLREVDDTGVGVPFAAFDYTRSPSGNVLSETDPTRPLLSSPLAYAYTPRNQLASVNGRAYDYDPADNLTGLPDGATLAYDAANQLQTLTRDGAVTNYRHDERGRRTHVDTPDPLDSEEYVYDQAGRLTQYRTVQIDPDSLVAAGESHSMALTADGAVYTWGDNAADQLGHGTGPQDTPGRVALDPSARVTSIAAGAAHSLAVEATGLVYAWGDDTYGQLGPPLLGGRHRTVAGPTDVVAVAAGSRHSLALTDQGVVWTWGRDTDPPLDGLGDTPLAGLTDETIDTLPDVTDPLPTPVAGLPNVVDIAAGGHPDEPGHSLALDADGNVWAFGANHRGQLGDGTRLDRAVPLLVTGLPKITDIAAAGDTSYALASDGELYAWGDNTHGQLGTHDGDSTARPVQVVGIPPLAQIAAGPTHVTAITQDGDVYGWGANHEGPAGCPTSPTTVPTEVTEIDDAALLAAGGHHTLIATTSGTVAALGANTHGQLGDGTTTDSCTPVETTELERVAAWPARQASYTYTGDGLRASKTVDSHAIVGLNTGPLPMTWDRTADIPLLLSDGHRDYIYGPAGIPVAQVPRLLGTGAEWLHIDQIGSVRAVTNDAGLPVARYDYDPYGNPTKTQEIDPEVPTRLIDLAPGEIGTTTPLRFAGEYLDWESGLIYLRARTYDPTTGQFLTIDPLVHLTQQPYLYAAGNPINLIDPLGLSPWDPFRNWARSATGQAARETLEILSAVSAAGAAAAATAVLPSVVAPPVALVLASAAGTFTVASVATGGAAAFLACVDDHSGFDCAASAASTMIPVASIGVVPAVAVRYGRDAARYARAGLSQMDVVVHGARAITRRPC